MFVELALLLAAGLGNLAWDLTGRRVSARARRRARRDRRGEHLPLPTADDSAEDPFETATVLVHAPRDFIERTRTTAEELDRIVDHFDLILLRAEAGEYLAVDIVYIGANAPRERGRELLEAWLRAAGELPAEVALRLRDLGLPDGPLATMLERERTRNRWPRADSASEHLNATANDFEAAFLALAAFLRTLTVASGNPYR